MDSDKEYKKSTELWILNQQKNIDIILCNIEYLKKEIDLKTELLNISKKSLDHEIKFLNDYKESLN